MTGNISTRSVGTEAAGRSEPKSLTPMGGASVSEALAAEAVTIDMFGDGPMLANYDDKYDRAHEIVEEAIEKFNLDQLWAFSSFGGDSLTVVEMFQFHRLFKGVVHINTGVGVPAVAEYGRKLCAERGWLLKEYATDPSVYRDWVLERGFPGPAMHQMMYINLKERRVDEFIREHKTHRRHNIGILSGARRQESKRRMGTAQPYTKRRSQIWINPILYFGEDDKARSETRFNIGRSPVSRELGMSGECLCGAMSDGDGPKELAALAAFYPETADYIKGLAAECRARGVWDQWGVKPPNEPVVHPDQMKLDMPMCTGCELRRAA